MEKIDQTTGLKYRVDGKFKMPCKLIDGSMQDFKLHLFSFSKENEFLGPEEHFHVLVVGDIQGKNDVLMRIESACTYAHLYGSQLCDCQFQLQEGLKNISKNGSGIYIYCLDQHGRGIGIVNHVKVYQAEQELGLDTVEAHLHHNLPKDARNYDPIIAILNHFNVKGVRLMSNNPQRLNLFEKYNLPVERIPHQGPLSEINKGELRIKKEKLGHLYSYGFENSVDTLYLDGLTNFLENSNEDELNSEQFISEIKEKLNKEVSWLDVGTGPGTKNINILRKIKNNHDLSLDVLEPSQEWINKLSNNFEKSNLSGNISKIYKSTWEEFSENKKYDLITFFHSVYGIQTESLEKIPSILTDNGVACIVVESDNSALNKIKKALFPHVHHKELASSSESIVNFLKEKEINHFVNESKEIQRFYVDDLLDEENTNRIKLLSFILQTKIQDQDKLVSKIVLDKLKHELKKYVKRDEKGKHYIEIPDAFIWISKTK